MKQKNMKPRLGQHFLKNPRAVRTIIAALDLRQGETILEIGPGEGALTIPLADVCQKIGCRLVAIEKDSELVESIRYKVLSNAEIIHGDILKLLPQLSTSYFIPHTSYKLVGNIPYYITGKLLRAISELPQKPLVSVLMVQREVAERITAEPPHMNLLAAATQVWAGLQIIMRLSPGDFSPPPDVESAVLKLTTNNLQLTTAEIASYYPFIRVFFKQPRKTVFNNLRFGYPTIPPSRIQEHLSACGIAENARPQDISLPVLIKLASHLRDSGIK